MFSASCQAARACAGSPEASLLGVAQSCVSAAEIVQADGLGAEVAKFPRDVKAFLVAGDCLGRPAELAVGGAEDPETGCAPAPVAAPGELQRDLAGRSAGSFCRRSMGGGRHGRQLDAWLEQHPRSVIASFSRFATAAAGLYRVGHGSQNLRSGGL